MTKTSTNNSQITVTETLQQRPRLPSFSEQWSGVYPSTVGNQITLQQTISYPCFKSGVDQASHERNNRVDANNSQQMQIWDSFYSALYLTISARKPSQDIKITSKATPA